MTTELGSYELPNARQEAFASYYAGECYGDLAGAYRKAGYTGTQITALAQQLLRRPEIADRVRWLRAQALRESGIDQYALLRRRVAIADDVETRASDRLTALRDIERALGLGAQENPQAVSAVQVEVRIVH
jgi:hypothetical protein